MTTSSLILSDRPNPIDQPNPNQLPDSSYTNSPRFKKALTRVYAQADWMARQGYGALPPYGKDAYLSEVMADACQGGF